MADRIFCIDFGSAYTKVALRGGPAVDARLISPSVPGSSGPLSFCVPTVVAVETRAGDKQHFEFGSAATGRTTQGNVRVFRNWKKSLFLNPSASAVEHPSLEALLASGELADLATRFAVTRAQIEHLRSMVSSARGALGMGAETLSPESTEFEETKDLAIRFFRWLRQEVLTSCDKLGLVGGGDFGAIPVRITAPAFAFGRGMEIHPGCQALTDALAQAGWPLHVGSPLVTEPYSNAIGVLTNGKNHTTPTGQTRLYTMLDYGPLRAVSAGDKHFPSYRALIVDVGAFTTDFASIDLDAKGESVTDIDAAVTISHHSVPIGISDLDTAVAAVSSPEKGDWLLKGPGYDTEAFRLRAYSDTKPFNVNISGKNFRMNTGEEGRAIQAAIQSFCRRLAAGVAEFCDGRKPASKQELILTGGGSSIPAVRDALQMAAEHGGHTYAKIHAPVKKKTAGGAFFVQLDDKMIRGGSAIGGVSLYFG